MYVVWTKTMHKILDIICHRLRSVNLLPRAIRKILRSPDRNRLQYHSNVIIKVHGKAVSEFIALIGYWAPRRQMCDMTIGHDIHYGDRKTSSVQPQTNGDKYWLYWMCYVSVIFDKKLCMNDRQGKYLI